MRLAAGWREKIPTDQRSRRAAAAAEQQVCVQRGACLLPKSVGRLQVWLAATSSRLTIGPLDRWTAGQLGGGLCVELDERLGGLPHAHAFQKELGAKRQDACNFFTFSSRQCTRKFLVETRACAPQLSEHVSLLTDFHKQFAIHLPGKQSASRDGLFRGRRLATSRAHWFANNLLDELSSWKYQQAPLGETPARWVLWVGFSLGIWIDFSVVQ